MTEEKRRMGNEKVLRPNRIVKLPRQLFQLMSELAYFQEDPITTQDFIIEILTEIGRMYGEKIQRESLKIRPGIVKSYLNKSGILNNPEENNRFNDNSRYFEDVNI